MSEEKLTQAEFAEIFGATIPLEAIDLVFNAPADMTIGELRNKLRAMGKTHKRRQAAADALDERISRYISQAAANELDWAWIFSDAARAALVAADAIAAPGGVPFDDSARTALAEIANIAFNMKQGESQPSIATAEFKRISERADVLLRLVDKARAGS